MTLLKSLTHALCGLSLSLMTLTSQAADYPWSSAAYHCGLRNDALVTPHPFDLPPSTHRDSYPD